VRVVFARVKAHFLDRFERQYGTTEYKVLREGVTGRDDAQLPFVLKHSRIHQRLIFWASK
jgi:hypothetical protein